MRVDARCIADGAICPVCGVWSNRVHGSYLRFPADVPSGGRSVVLQLRVRRFICGNSGCARRTFVEQIPGLTRRHGQRTERLRSTLAGVGLALAGRAGARIARVLGVRQPQYGGGRSSRARGGRSTCGRRRRVCHPQGPPLRNRPGRHRNAPPQRPAARPGGIQPRGLAHRTTRR
ncbi:transposase family protein [Streptomyces sp. NPDC007914]|uniref:transposase family protein n=1 Tax=Streptomyces sp. NPDC007914 TaxID=3364791 RepID=UPI0036E57A2A